MDKLFASQRDYFMTGATKPCAVRIAALKRLRKGVLDNQKAISEALFADLRKSEFESYATEIGFVLAEISTAIKNVKRWNASERRNTPLFLFPSKSYIRHEPYGVVLIISPWNYPFQLSFAPLVGAIAAGNCVCLKPSADAPATARVMMKIVSQAFDPKYVVIADASNETTGQLLQLPFDYIFYTGGVEYGKHVMRAAAENLIPVTLELGGKSPCVVERDADLGVAARRIVWGKFLNCGQTCVAPDYIMVHNSVKSQLIDKLREQIAVQFGENVKQSPDYPRIINHRRFDRLIELMEGSHILCGGESDREQKYIAPTLLDNVPTDSPLMREEIFGPLLPIIGYDHMPQAIEYINSQPRPLALYCFTQSRERAEKVMDSCISGGCAINDVVIHVANGNLPFSGVGNSGMGAYHGKYSFDTFSHARAVMRSSTRINIGIKFAPYAKKVDLMKKLLK